MLDYHVHLWPHGTRAEPDELRIERLTSYCKKAEINGVSEIALTEHLFRFTVFSDIRDGLVEENPACALNGQMSRYFLDHMTEDLDAYIAACLSARDEGLPIIIGLEVDFCPGRMDRVADILKGYPFDVLLGSVHWLGSWLFDNLDEAASRDEWDSRDIEEVWRSYTEALEELAATRTVDVLAHPDLVKIFGRYPDRGLIDESHSRIAEAASRSGITAELSSAGWRKPVGEAYPAPNLLRKFYLAGVPISTASDSHGEEFVADRMSELRDLAQGAGYGSLRAYRLRAGRDVAFGTDAHRPPASWSKAHS